MPMLRSPCFARAKRAPPKAARASRAQEKGDHNMGAPQEQVREGNPKLTGDARPRFFESMSFARGAGATRAKR